MKKAFLVALFALAAFAQLSAQNLIGRWAGTQGGEEMTFVFDKDGYASMGAEGAEIGGKNFMLNKRACYMKFVLSSTSKPNDLDLVVYDLQTNKEVKRMLCIIEFITADAMRICMALDEENKRPRNFSNKDNVLLLHRRK